MPHTPTHSDANATWHAALDTSTPLAALAVGRPGEPPVLELSDLPLGRRSAETLPAMLEALARVDIPLGAIRCWTVGMGPGSFAGIRLGAAMVLGFAAATQARVRGIPTSLALARQTAAITGAAPGARIATLSDGRRGQVIISLWQVPESAGAPWTACAEAYGAPIEDLTGLDVQHLAILAGDAATEPVEALGLPLTVLPLLDVAALLDAPGFAWPTDRAEDPAQLEPVYVRPAVFVAPRTVRPEGT